MTNQGCLSIVLATEACLSLLNRNAHIPANSSPQKHFCVLHTGPCQCVTGSLSRALSESTLCAHTSELAVGLSRGRTVLAQSEHGLSHKSENTNELKDEQTRQTGLHWHKDMEHERTDGSKAGSGKAG